MVVIRPHQTSVTLFGRDGSVVSYPSKKAAQAALGYSWIARHVGEQFRQFSHNNWLHPSGHSATIGYRLNGYTVFREAVYDEYPYVMRDDWGKPLTVHDFDWPRKRYSGRYSAMLDNWNGEGPVPGVSKPKAGRHQFRRISHINAKRGAETFVDEGEVPPRARRNVHHLPNNWDDHYPNARRNRNWKRFRDTQYRAEKA